MPMIDNLFLVICFMFHESGFLTTIPVFVNNRKFKKSTNSGLQSRFTHMLLIIHIQT